MENDDPVRPGRDSVRDFSPMTKKSPLLGVLVVDDEALIRWALCETLTAQGHTVLEAGDGRGAMEVLRHRQSPIDVVLLDHRLPDMTGLQVLASIRQLSPASKVLLMTAYGTPEVVQQALQLGAVSVVHKPLEMNDVADLVLRTHNFRHIQ
jgi:DNA-binding NtrC family response regulator